MSSLKQIKLMQQNAVKQQEVIKELNGIVNDIERCEKTIVSLQQELETVNVKHQNRKTTRDDVDYLTDLLKCANKKLTWEKHLASLQKRTPAILEKMTRLLNDPNSQPDENTRAQILASLQAVQKAMERLQSIQVR
jgi:hypothetical protein